MKTVRTKEDFKKALEAKERKIVVVGALAASMRKKAKVKKASKIGGIALIAGGIIAVPFTAGTSLVGTAAGLTFAGAAATVTLSAAELAILCGCALGIYGIYKNCKVSYKSDGSVEVEPKYN